MLRTIATYMVVLWLLLIAFNHTAGGWIHVLPVFAIIMVFISAIQQRRSLGKKRVKAGE
ncbi:MAG: DUF5670 family protein [Desulfobacteraceae bacterium]